MRLREGLGLGSGFCFALLLLSFPASIVVGDDGTPVSQTTIVPADASLELVFDGGKVLTEGVLKMHWNGGQASRGDILCRVGLGACAQ